MFDITARSRETGDVYQLNDPEDLAEYRREISDFNYYHGGEVNGPGTGTLDSVPARLSDGEFIMTAASYAVQVVEIGISVLPVCMI